MNETYAQRMRVTFSTADTVKYVGHLDMHRAWERAIRRARLPLAYTQGFNPQARLQFAAALPVGFTGQGEVADVFLNEALDPAEFLGRLAAALPPGIRPLRAEPVAREAPSLQSQVCGAHYRVEVETDEADALFAARLDGFLARPEAWRERRKGKDVRAMTCGRWCRSWPTPGRAPTGNRSPLRCAQSRARRAGPTNCWRRWTSSLPRAASFGRNCCLSVDCWTKFPSGAPSTKRSGFDQR